MKIQNDNTLDPKKIEKEIGEFLHEKYGDTVKLVSPVIAPDNNASESDGRSGKSDSLLNFDLKPEELAAYLDQYIIRQDEAKRILATKICTHFNRVRHQELWGGGAGLVGGIKNNVLMIGPTGVGKTYMIKLIARKLGVPFIKGDATKFSETGYVGGDVEDLVRDLVREAGDDIELAQHGIIYIDEIDKIAASRNLVGADVSRSGVQRALLTLMEETEVEMRVPHDPVSIMQEMERYRQSGTREKRSVNTRNILFIMSGAFTGLQEIINKRMNSQAIGFGAQINSSEVDPYAAMRHIRSEDLTEFGFEAEFIGRLPVRVIFENLTENDLFDILKNPSNPVVLSKKIDFAAYGIDIKFDDKALRTLARHAYQEKTGARGLVNSVERALIGFESGLPSTPIKKFPVTEETVSTPEEVMASLMSGETGATSKTNYNELCRKEKRNVRDFIDGKCRQVAEQYDFPLSPERIDLLADYAVNRITTMESAIETVKAYYDETKNIEAYFYAQYDLDIVLAEDATLYLVRQYLNNEFTDFETKCREMARQFLDGFKLLSEKAGIKQFYLTQQALMFPESWLDAMIKKAFGMNSSRGQANKPELVTPEDDATKHDHPERNGREHNQTSQQTDT
ncbi:MAG: AAA family ATPase [Desulfosudaceae bacterium]